MTENRHTKAAVYLNIYDLDEAIASINNVFKKIGSGVFHTGVQVYGYEYAYGKTEEERSGVYCHYPTDNISHHFRESVYLGDTPLDSAAVSRVIRRISSKWLGTDYHLFRKNCTSFCETLCMELQVGTGRFPLYISNLMNAAKDTADGLINVRDVLVKTGSDMEKGFQNFSQDIAIGFDNTLKEVTNVFSMLGGTPQ